MFGSQAFGQWRYRVRGLFARFGENAVPPAELEALLFEADFSAPMVQKLLEVAKRFRGKKLDEVYGALRAEIQDEMKKLERELPPLPLPGAILLLGVNGAGKTTVAGKLARRFRADGKAVVLAAADTFRAGAIDQLRRWGERTGAEVVSQSEGADPAAVAYDAWSRAIARNAVLIADTAGRLHTKQPLMEELRKIVRVLGKDGRGAPHETFLVLDGTLGQNSLMQAREFQKAVPLTGLIVTKLDGTAKGGAALTAAIELNVPIRFIGVGEREDHLVPFEPALFAAELFQV